MWQQLLDRIREGDTRALARIISLVENEQEGYEEFLAGLPATEDGAIIGITGPPGAGKSTLTDGLVAEMIRREKKVAVLCVDPSSPFHLGALLGDRIRMSQWYTHPSVFIRSLATRGSMGGLHPKILEIVEVLKCAGFEYILIETVGVGQSEIEIAGLADATVVVVVPEAGDEIQTMKAGLMEIADVFVVNKTDRPDADIFIKNLRLMLAPAFNRPEPVPVIKTVASQNQGIDLLYEAIHNHLAFSRTNERRTWLLAERAWKLIQQNRLSDLDKSDLVKRITKENGSGFNLYKFARQFYTIPE